MLKRLVFLCFCKNAIDSPPFIFPHCIISLPPFNRSKRFAMVVEDGVVVGLEVEPDGTGLTCSLAPKVLEKL